jgi:hypothetical protein
MTSIEYHPSDQIADGPDVGGWRTSTTCVPNGNCAEINRGRSDRVGVRDSKRPATTATLEFRSSAWARFLDQLKGSTPAAGRTDDRRR